MENTVDDTLTLYGIKDKRTGLYVGWDNYRTLGAFGEASFFRSKNSASEVADTVRGNLIREKGQVTEMQVIELIVMNGGVAL